MKGDIRCSPFVEPADVKACIEGAVKEFNDSLDTRGGPGPYSKYVLPDDVPLAGADRRRGEVILTFTSTDDTISLFEGIACSLESESFKALVQATREVRGEAKPYSISGSLPLVKQMQRAGFDLQLVGFGVMAVYHGNDEYTLLSDAVKGHAVIQRVLALLETTT